MIRMRFIDLNCDAGEGAGSDAALMSICSSANIACGAHAGDDESMRSTVRLALANNVAIGAHPGFLDRAHFGRRELVLSESEIVDLVIDQVARLRTIAAGEGGQVGHVKPHGALYNLAARDEKVAVAIAAAVAQVDDSLVLYGLAGGKLLTAGRARGLRVASEVFADRTYQADGSLTPRNRVEALINDSAATVAQVLSLVNEGRVCATDGTEVAIVADTVCVHGDGPHAVELARAVRGGIERAGVCVRCSYASRPV